MINRSTVVSALVVVVVVATVCRPGAAVHSCERTSKNDRVNESEWFDVYVYVCVHVCLWIVYGMGIGRGSNHSPASERLSDLRASSQWSRARRRVWAGSVVLQGARVK